MTLLLHKSSAQASIEDLDTWNRSDDDYAVVDDTIVGRIYREMIIGEPKWRWCLQQISGAPPWRTGAAEPGNCRHAGSVQEAL